MGSDAGNAGMLSTALTVLGANWQFDERSGIDADAGARGCHGTGPRVIGPGRGELALSRPRKLAENLSSSTATRCRTCLPWANVGTGR